MVRQTFVGPGVAINNVLFRGDSAAIGIFDGRNSNIGLDSGILITTGKAIDAIGPNNGIASTSQDGGRTDGDLNSLLSSGVTKDASFIQFTFTPSSSVATFKFVFASEEYPDFVGKPYNDIFGFFLSGPGIVGKKNLALIPGTQDPISINTINANVNSNLYVSNTNGTSVQYNGFTKVIEIVADNLIPCENYTLKMSIADVVDAIYDSGIFLASMDSKAPNNAYINNIIPSPGTDVIQEKCDSIVFRFNRSGTDLSNNQLVKYAVSGTATRGVDYTNIPDSIIIPAGKAFQDLKIFPVDDNVAENAETIIITITNNTVCAISMDSLEIKDYDTLKIDSYQDVFCKGDTIYKQVVYTGGSSHMSFIWTDSLGAIKGASSVLEASPDSLTMYIITIYDTCLSYQVKDTIYIPPIRIIELQIPNDTIVCAPLDLNLFVNANLTGLKYKWTALDPSQNPVGTFSNDTVPNPIYSVPDGVYEIIVTCTVDSPNHCSNNPSFRIRTIPKGIYGPKTVYVCVGDSTTLRAYGGGIYKWSPSDGIVGDTTLNTIKVFKPGLYTAEITDTVNCTREYTVNVVYDTIPIANAGKDYVICERSSIQLNAAGSQYNTYEWTPATGLTNSKIGNPIASPLVTTTYILKAKNNACFSFDTMTIKVIIKPENEFTYDFDSCEKVIAFNNTTAGTDSFYWDFGDGNYSTEKNPVHSYRSTTGTVTVSLYTNRGTDCMDTSSVDIKLVDVDPTQRKIPNVFTPNGDNINDVFKVTGGNVGCAITKMSIYNRWGKLLHEINDAEVWEWDGKIGGVLAPQGVYFYSIIGQGFEDVGLVNIVY